MRSMDLTPAEQAKPYAKYFTRKPAAPDPARLELMARPMDPAKALRPERINDLLNPGYHEVETGWCILPNGAGYIANLTKMPGVTVDMMNWWFGWHALEDLRYKIWYPACHHGISIPDSAERARVLDPATPAVKRFQGTTHHVIEDIGSGPEDILIKFLPPEEMGFDMTRFKSPAVGTLVGGWGKTRPVGAFFLRPWAPSMMCHFIRETEDGIEMRTRFWMGYKVKNRKPKCVLPPFVKVPGKIPQGLAIHNIHEYANLASFLPELYAEMKGKVTA